LLKAVVLIFFDLACDSDSESDEGDDESDEEPDDDESELESDEDEVAEELDESEDVDEFDFDLGRFELVFVVVNGAFSLRMTTDATDFLIGVSSDK